MSCFSMHLFHAVLGIHDCVADKGYMYMWTEEVARRGICDIANIILKHFVQHPPKSENLVVYSDNCWGQNKNGFFVAFWFQLIREHFYRNIEHRFFVSGHTYMPCDTDFAIIEKYKKKNVSNVYCPNDWFEIVKNASEKNPFEVCMMKQEDFIDLNELLKRNMTDDISKLNFKDIHVFLYSWQNMNSIAIKHFVNEEPKQVNLARKGMRSNVYVSFKDLKPFYSNPIKLNPLKVRDLKTLLKHIPSKDHEWYLKIIEQNNDKVEHGDLNTSDKVDGSSEDETDGEQN